MSVNYIKITSGEMQQAAGLERLYCIYCKDGREYTGKLIALDRKGLTLLTDDGSESSFLWSKVSLAEQLDHVPPDVPDAEVQAWRKQQQKDLNAGDVFTLLSLCRPLFDRLAVYECPRRLKDILSIRSRRQLKNYFFMDRSEMDICLEQLDALLRLSRQPEDQRIIARTFIFFLGKDFATALRELLPRVLNGETDCFLPTICLYSDMGDGVAAFFWAMRYFDRLLRTPEEMDATARLRWTQKHFENSPYWWAYLRQAVAFDYFERVLEHIELLYRSAPNLAVRSLAYLFSLKNDKYRGELLYRESQSFEQPLPLETLRTFYTSLSYHIFVKDWNSFFYRYYLRAEQIIHDKHYCSYEDGMEMTGYIYEYVSQRDCYCRVLGLDLISYFLHLDNDPSTNEIRRKCHKEMGSLQSVRHELPVRIRFRSDREITAMRKSYQISSSILD